MPQIIIIARDLEMGINKKDKAEPSDSEYFNGHKLVTSWRGREKEESLPLAGSANFSKRNHSTSKCYKLEINKSIVADRGNIY